MRAIVKRLPCVSGMLCMFFGVVCVCFVPCAFAGVPGAEGRMCSSHLARVVRVEV